MNKEVKSPIDCLFDENNTDDIVLQNEEGKQITFEQIALIPLKEKTYAILKPVDKLEGVGENEALVFSIDESNKGENLTLVTDDKTIDEVFTVYDELVDDANCDDHDCDCDDDCCCDHDCHCNDDCN